MRDKIYIHWNLPRQILKDSAKSKNFNLTVFKKSSYLEALRDGFIHNGIEPIFNFRMHYFFNYNWLYSSRFYKYFFYFYNFFFGILDNYLLYNLIFREIKKSEVKYYYTELNPTITKYFLKKLNKHNIKSIEWFGLFPSQLNYNTRPNKTINYFDLIASGEDYLPYFKYSPKNFLKIPQAIPLNKINSIKINNKESIDILFIGSVSKIHSNRWDYLEFLILNFKSVELYGFGIEQVPNKYNFKKKFGNSLWGNEYYQKIKQSKIVLNLFQDDYENLNDGINIRAFEIPACNALQICKRLPFISNYFEENFDIVLFDSIQEMNIKLKYYLANNKERKRIIKNSFNTIQKYDFPNHLKLIIDACNKI